MLYLDDPRGFTQFGDTLDVISFLDAMLSKANDRLANNPTPDNLAIVQDLERQIAFLQQEE